MQLEDLGWTPSRSNELDRDAHPHRQPGRIARIDGARATAWTTSGEQFVDLPSKLRRGQHSLVVGDWITIDPMPDGSARAAGVLERHTSLGRRAAGRQVRRQLLAANVDTAFIVSSMDDDLRERRLERYLTVVHDGGVTPVILLTKAGLVDDPEPFLRRARSVASDVAVHAIDVLAGIGVDVLETYVQPGATITLLGSSGVGKSTVVNHLMGRTTMATHAVRTRDGRGQHTTTYRELFLLPNGGIVIDTPGLRELALWTDASALDRTFPDVEALARDCRFGDCTHGHEPGCAVLEAVAEGTLDAGRFESYVELHREVERTAAQMPTHERRRAERKLGKMYREIQQHKRRRR